MSLGSLPHQVRVGSGVWGGGRGFTCDSGAWSGCSNARFLVPSDRDQQEGMMRRAVQDTCSLLCAMYAHDDAPVGLVAERPRPHEIPKPYFSGA